MCKIGVFGLFEGVDYSSKYSKSLFPKDNTEVHSGITPEIYYYTITYCILVQNMVF